VRPVGSSDLLRVDVRVVAATHQDIAARIDEGRVDPDELRR
jgi:DNA-binding NtrC family response regulator